MREGVVGDTFDLEGRLCWGACVRDYAVDNDEPCMRVGSLTKVAQNLDGVLVGPVVQDASHQEHGRAMHRLWREEIMG